MMSTSYQCKYNQVCNIPRKSINEVLPPKEYLSSCNREEIVSIYAFYWINAYVYCNPKDNISLSVWFLKYINFWNILGSNCTRPSTCNEPIQENEFKQRSSKCSNRIKQKNACYFIYAIWYRYPFIQTVLYMRKLYKSIFYN